MTEGRITRADIEGKLRDMRGEVQETAEAAKAPIMAIAAGAMKARERGQLNERP